MKIKNFSKIKPDVSYLAGALRDGTVDTRIGKNYEIKIGQKEEKWLSETLKPIIENNFNVRVTVKNNLLRVTNKKFVFRIIELFKFKTKGWNTPEVIKQLSLEERKPYIMGFWDAEGGLPKNPKKCKRAEQTYISFHQKELEPLEFIQKTLQDLGFITTNMTKCKGAFEFRITRKNEILRFIKEIGTKHPDKQKRLNELKNVL